MLFTFIEGFPEKSTWLIDPGIFHDRDHLKLQSDSGWHTFSLLHKDQVHGIVHFHLQDGVAESPYRSPFGSYIFSDQVTEGVLLDFIGYCEKQLIRKNAKSVILKNQPEAYSTQRSKLQIQALNKLGYLCSTNETSAVIQVSNRPFEAGLHRSEKKRLRKCRESNLSFEIIPHGQLQKIYGFLEACRKEKGYSLSMSFKDVTKLVTAFPARIMLTAVIDRSQLVAANISIRVYNHVLYNFYHDHASEYDLLSPLVLLNEGLYLYCQNEGIEFLDLGTSNIEGELNESLLNFKLNLGAETSRKLTFVKNFA